MLNPSQLMRFLDFCHQNQTIDLLTQRNRLLATQLPQAKPAAVLVAIANASSQHSPAFLLTKRALSLHHHAGQIAFAGGKHDPNDPHLIQTALREAHEEIGTPAPIWHVHGSLPECRTPSGFVVTPVLASSTTHPTLHINPTEVSETFWLPLEYALCPAHYHGNTMPELIFQNHRIWGLTALILFHLAHCYVLWEKTFDKQRIIR